MDECALLPLLQDLDEKALETVYNTVQPLLYRYVYHLLGNLEATEDIVGETFHRLLHALDVGRGPRQYIQAWLYRVAHNLAIDYCRQRSPESFYALDQDRLASPEEPEEEVQRRWTQEQIHRALQRLTPDQQVVVVLKFLEGLSNEQVAEILGKPTGAVKSLQHRALARMRRILEASDLARWEEKQ